VEREKINLKHRRRKISKRGKKIIKAAASALRLRKFTLRIIMMLYYKHLSTKRKIRHTTQWKLYVMPNYIIMR
jgi:hypothetical protein